MVVNGVQELFCYVTLVELEQKLFFLFFSYVIQGDASKSIHLYPSDT